MNNNHSRQVLTNYQSLRPVNYNLYLSGGDGGDAKYPKPTSKRDIIDVLSEIPPHFTNWMLEGLLELISTGHVVYSTGLADDHNNNNNNNNNNIDHVDYDEDEDDSKASFEWFPIGPDAHTKQEFETNYNEQELLHLLAVAEEYDKQDDQVLIKQKIHRMELIRKLNSYSTQKLVHSHSRFANIRNEATLNKKNDGSSDNDFERSLLKLKDDLLFTVGADVVTGTVFAHDNNSNNIKTKQKNNEHDDKSGAAAATSSSSTATTTSSSSQHREKGLGSSAHPGTEIDSFTFSVAKAGPITVPIDKHTAQLLYTYADDSQFGHSEHGTVYDPSIRQSKEYDAKKELFDLPPFLENPRDSFPEVRELIMNQLCPQEAENIAFVPFKLVCYRDGDFFKAHTDSVTDVRNFGIFALHLPLVGDLESEELHDDPDRFFYYDGAKSGRTLAYGEQVTDRMYYDRNSKFHFTKMLTDVDGSLETEYRRFGFEEVEKMKPFDPNTDPFGHEEQDQERRAQGGRLRFFLGRYADSKENYRVPYGSENAVVNQNCDGSYDRPDYCSEQLVASIMMQNYTKEEVFEGKQFLSHQQQQQQTSSNSNNCMNNKSSSAAASSSSSKQTPFCSDEVPPSANDLAWGHPTTEIRHPEKGHIIHDVSDRKLLERANRAKQLKRERKLLSSENDNNNKKRRRYLPLKFAAWNHQVLHDVEPLGRNSYRFVLLYKLYRKNQQVCVPRVLNEKNILDHIEALGKCFADKRKKKSLLSSSSSSSRSPTSFGIILRNQYPFESLQDWRNLKGSDLMAYHLISQRFQCVVTPVVFSRLTTPSHAFAENRLCQVAICAEPPKRFNRNDFGVSESEFMNLDTYSLEDQIFETVFKTHPCLTKLYWIELGLGTLSAWSSIYANHDAGKEWHLRSAALICTMKPSFWDRRRVLFLIALKGAKDEQKNYIRKFEAKFYPIFRNIAYFM